jgi:hypothetical protein
VRWDVDRFSTREAAKYRWETRYLICLSKKIIWDWLPLITALLTRYYRCYIIYNHHLSPHQLFIIILSPLRSAISNLDGEPRVSKCWYCK